MEKIFTNKSIWKKIVVAILIVMAFQVLFSVPVVRADGEDDAAQEGDNIVDRGILMRPIMSLCVSIGDGLIYNMHQYIMGTTNTLIKVPMKREFIQDWLDAVDKLSRFTTAFIPFGNVLRGLIADKSNEVKSLLRTTVPGDTIIKDGNALSTFSQIDVPSEVNLPFYTYTPEEIFKGNIKLFNVDFFTTATKPKEGKNFYYYEDEKGEDLDIDGDGKTDTKGYMTSKDDSAEMLRNTVSRWYIALRNICIVGMLSVLIYIGIRMMLTSIASDKAKYKQMFKDWLVGLCLLFVLHYIMAFSVTLVKKFTDMVSTSVDKHVYSYLLYSDDLTDEKIGFTKDQKQNVEDTIKKFGLENYAISENGSLIWPTNLMGYLRLKIQFDKNFGQYIGEIICFLTLVFFTAWFTFTYFKRVLYMAFLTIIAPFVALTYSIDKTNDGQAQGFNMWLKEYIFNLLIQPMHLLLYFILVTSSFDLAGKNVLYSLVALGFMLPAEKLLRSMFGFEKAKTPPFLGGPVGTSLVMQGLNRLSSAAKSGITHSRGTSVAQKNTERIDVPEHTRDATSVADLVGGRNNPDATDGETEEETIPKTTNANTEGMEQPDQNTPLTGSSYTETMPTEDTTEPIRQVPIQELDDSEHTESIDSNNDELWRPTQKVLDWREKRKENRKIRAARGHPKLDKFKGNVNSATSYVKDKGRRIDTNLDKLAPKRWKRVKKGAKIAGAVGGTMVPKIARGALGITVGAAAGAGIATIAGAAALATGDPSKVLTATGTSFATGGAIGRRVANANPSNFISPDVRAAIDKVNRSSMSSEEYKKERMEKYIAELKRDQELRARLEEIDKDTAKSMMESGNFDKYVELGYGTDKEGLKQMIASERLIRDRDFSTVKNPEDAARVKKTAERMGDLSKMSGDKKAKWKDTFAQEYSDANILQGDAAKRGAQTTMDMAERYQKYLS
ncbi:MAG: hypothetical protein IKF97_01405 [Clostridia bacterium]|nr:hypothetical protein [Clostridia bacterium]